MRKSDQKTSSPDSNGSSNSSSFWHWKPVAMLSAFFYPVSKAEMQETLDRIQLKIDSSRKLIKETEEFHKEIDVLIEESNNMLKR